MINEVVIPPIWLKLPVTVRQHIADSIGFTRSGGVVSYQRNGVMEVQSDGFTQDDLNKITKEALQKALELEEPKDFWEMFWNLAGIDFDEDVESPEEEPEKVIHKCDTCDRVFKSKSGLASHKKKCYNKDEEPTKADDTKSDEKISTESESSFRADGDREQNGDEGESKAK